MIPALALAAALLAGARAEEPQVVAHEAPALSIRASLGPANSWTVVEQGYPHVLRIYAKQVEAAPANRYFPRSLVWVKPGFAGPGRFLDVRCGTLKRNKPCPSKSVQLEARVLAVSLVRLLPTGRPPSALFDDTLFRLTDEGEDAFKAAQDRWPDLWPRLRRLAAASLGRAGAPNVIESSRP